MLPYLANSFHFLTIFHNMLALNVILVQYPKLCCTLIIFKDQTPKQMSQEFIKMYLKVVDSMLFLSKQN